MVVVARYLETRRRPLRRTRRSAFCGRTLSSRRKVTRFLRALLRQGGWVPPLLLMLPLWLVVTAETATRSSCFTSTTMTVISTRAESLEEGVRPQGSSTARRSPPRPLPRQQRRQARGGRKLLLLPSPPPLLRRQARVSALTPAQAVPVAKPSLMVPRLGYS